MHNMQVHTFVFAPAENGTEKCVYVDLWAKHKVDYENEGNYATQLQLKSSIILIPYTL